MHAVGVARFELGWEALVAAVVALVVLAFLGAVWLARDPRPGRLRLGFFIERDVDDEPPDG